MNKRERMNERIRKHGNDLNKIFGLHDDPVRLCKLLRRLEVQGNGIACALCNGEIEQETYEKNAENVLNRLFDLIGRKWEGVVIINGDPRGYALKIRDDYVRENNIEVYRDWGGYGILAPDLTND